MKHFKNFEEFFRHLIDSMSGDKDIYIFRYVLSDESDYQLVIEEKSNEYYVHWSVDFDKIQEILSVMFSDEEDVHISLDYVPYTDDEDNLSTYQRLFIFRSK